MRWSFVGVAWLVGGALASAAGPGMDLSPSVLAKVILKRATESLDHKDYPRVIELTTVAQQLAPTDACSVRAYALRLRGTAYAGQHDWKKSVTDCSEAIRLMPGYADAFARRGAAFGALKEFDRAIADLTEAIRLDPRHSYALITRAWVWGLKKDDDRAVTDLDEALRIDSNDTQALTMRAGAYLSRGENDRAIRDCDTAIRLDSNCATAWSYRARAYFVKGESVRATADASEALRLNPRDPTALFVRARVYLEGEEESQKHFREADDRAIKDLNELVRLRPTDPEVWRMRGVAYSRLNDPVHALDDLNEAVRLAPNNPRILRERARFRIERRQYAHALDDFSAVLQLDPRDTYSLYNVVLIEAASPDDFLRDGKHAVTLAKAACDRAERPDTDLMVVLAAAYAETGQFAEAVRWQKQVLKGIVAQAQRADAEVVLKQYEEGKPYRLPPRDDAKTTTPGVFRIELRR